MQQNELYREVARATGETFATVKRLGFLLADPLETHFDPESPDLGPSVIDWDELEARRHASEGGSPNCAPICI